MELAGSANKSGLWLSGVYTLQCLGLEWQQYKDDRSTRRLMYNVHTNLSGCRVSAGGSEDATLTTQLAHPYDKSVERGGGYIRHVSAQRRDAPPRPDTCK